MANKSKSTTDVKTNDIKSAKQLEGVSAETEIQNSQNQGSGIEAYLPANDQIKQPEETITENWQKEPDHLVSVPGLSGDKNESEADFLVRLLGFQHGGSFGKHLDPLIVGRLKAIGGHDGIHIENGRVVDGKKFAEEQKMEDEEAERENKQFENSVDPTDKDLEAKSQTYNKK